MPTDIELDDPLPPDLARLAEVAEKNLTNEDAARSAFRTPNTGLQEKIQKRHAEEANLLESLMEDALDGRAIPEGHQDVMEAYKAVEGLGNLSEGEMNWSPEEAQESESFQQVRARFAGIPAQTSSSKKSFVMEKKTQPKKGKPQITESTSEGEPSAIAWMVTDVDSLRSKYPQKHRVSDLDMVIKAAYQQPGMPFGIVGPHGTAMFVKVIGDGLFYSIPPVQPAVTNPRGHTVAKVAMTNHYHNGAIEPEPDLFPNPNLFFNVMLGPDGDDDGDDHIAGSKATKPVNEPAYRHAKKPFIPDWPYGEVANHARYTVYEGKKRKYCAECDGSMRPSSVKRKGYKTFVCDDCGSTKQEKITEETPQDHVAEANILLTRAQESIAKDPDHRVENLANKISDFIAESLLFETNNEEVWEQLKTAAEKLGIEG